MLPQPDSSRKLPVHRLEQRIGGIFRAATLFFSYLLILSALFGLPSRALSPPLTFNIFFWLFFVITAGFIVSYFLRIRFTEGKWGLFPGSEMIFKKLGAGSEKITNLLFLWNALCISWIIINLFFLYSGMPLIDSNTYGVGLGVMVIGNVIIGLFLVLSNYGTD